MTMRYTMKEAAQQLGRHKLTLYRWEKERKIPKAKRFARNNARVYTDDDIEQIRRWMDATVDPEAPTAS
jgi:excisionase family DNA binding protein